MDKKQEVFVADLLFRVHNLEMDKKQEEQLLKWYEEVPTNTEPLDSDDDLSDAVSEHSLRNTDTEQSDDGDEVLVAQSITAVIQPRTKRDELQPNEGPTDQTKPYSVKPSMGCGEVNPLTTIPI
ncbi:hypothetical protein QE152_g21894 [Popillia japonica]|uniref:Uncharacterized protein n=1 Tax=Popillia japonica TaxID=7064 RepID=A0AAW1KML6_POPJA